MKCAIERVENGFEVSYLDEWDDGTKHRKKIVFEDKPETADEDGELDSLRDALYAVKEQLGYHYSKHNKVNLVIDLEGKEED